MIIPDHAIVRFLQRYESIKLNHAVRNYTDTEIIDYIERMVGLDREYLRDYIELICDNRQVGLYGPGYYPIGRKCKAIFKNDTVITVVPA